MPALLVTHDFAEAALLGDRVGVIDGGRVVQLGTPAELAAAPASAFVADFTGATVLTGTARSDAGGLTVVALDGGGEIRSVDSGSGAVAASVYPWEISLEPPAGVHSDSARNRLPVEVVSVTTLGNRVRVGLAAPQPLAAEITAAAAEELGLRAGVRVTAAWKATATRLGGGALDGSARPPPPGAKGGAGAGGPRLRLRDEAVEALAADHHLAAVDV